MPHRIQPFIEGMSAAAEKVLYGAGGTLSGIAGSKTSRDLQDLYIRDKRIKFEKPYTNLNKWQKQYNIRYVWKKRFKGDFLIESSNTQQEALLSDDPIYGNQRSYQERTFSSRSRITRGSKPSRRRKHHKSCLCRVLVNSSYYKHRKFHRRPVQKSRRKQQYVIRGRSRYR